MQFYAHQEHSAEDQEEDYPGERTAEWEWQHESFQPYSERIDRSAPSNPYTASVAQHHISKVLELTTHYEEARRTTAEAEA